MGKKPVIRFEGFTEDWEQRKLGEVADKVYGGGTPQTSEKEFWDGNIPWFQSADLIEHDVQFATSKKAITTLGLRKSAAQLIPGNSIAIVTRVGVGKLVFMPVPYATSQDFLSLSELNIDEKFGCYAIYRLLQREKNLTQGTSIKGITKDELLKKKICIPIRMEQKKIGHYFTQLDTLITLHQRNYEKIEATKKVMLEKLFPQGEDKVPAIRFDGFIGDWKKKPLSAILIPYSDPVEVPHDGYERLGIRSHGKGVFHEYVKAGEEITTAQLHRVAAHNFIVNITFAWEHAVAITCDSDAGKLVSHRFPQFSMADGIHDQFLKYLVLDARFRHHLLLSSPGGAGRNRVLKIQEMLEYEMMIPDIKEQKQIANYLNSLDELIELYRIRMEKLKNIKAACLQRMFV